MSKERFDEITNSFNASGVKYEGTHSLLNWVQKNFPTELDEYAKMLEKYN